MAQNNTTISSTFSPEKVVNYYTSSSVDNYYTYSYTNNSSESLFLDELPEFKRTALEVLRQPMEERRITISRAKMTIEYPASFMLVAAMNPCPCGYYNHPTIECTCPPGSVRKYMNKVSGPLMDRIETQKYFKRA